MLCIALMHNFNIYECDIVLFLCKFGSDIVPSPSCKFKSSYLNKFTFCLHIISVTNKQPQSSIGNEWFWKNGTEVGDDKNITIILINIER